MYRQRWRAPKGSQSYVELASTSAGIPDFRSSGGLYNSKLPDLPPGMKADELFDTPEPKKTAKFKASGRFLAALRIFTKSVEPTAAHKLIAKLFDRGVLSRCITQNIDGIQTRDRKDMSCVVLELHGTNARLLCNKCNKPPNLNENTLDKNLQQYGEARCTDCRRNTWENRLRSLSPGYLIPDIVFNQDSREHELAGMSLDQMQEVDGQADILLVVGTSLATPGAAALVRSLARRVHQHGGGVLYVSGAPPSGSGWSRYIDMRLEMDIEEWANDMLSRLNEGQGSTERSCAKVSDILTRDGMGELTSW
ncbi:NAD-dependent histone deacetylase SIR2 [Ceratobasidium sp. AG-Ba]|nr:NAD-dependent histone deacetylase SIR2 [Ceratobasidium sp. AG-Ba]